MSIVKKTKEFLGLAPYETDAHDEAYYADEPRYSGTAAYAPDYHRPAGYDSYDYDRPEPRGFQPTIVPVELRSYEDAQEIGSAFREGDTVVFDMHQLARDDSRRIIDFAAGLCFALRGTMKKVSPLVFAVIPEGVTVSTSELERAVRVH